MSQSSPSATASKINCSRFYFEYHGHQIDDLTTFHKITLAERPDKPIIYLAGDSSLDNKYWVCPGHEVSTEAPDIYRKTLSKPEPKPDVAFWMNHILQDRATCINTAVEESMLRHRDDKLREHDEFIRNNIRKEDILIISVGGNDVALSPTYSTIRHILQLAWLTSRASLEAGTAGSLQYFKTFFGTKIQNYVVRLVAKTKPRAVIVCMIYFPLESGLGQTSWADTQLKAMGYNSSPGQLQAAIRTIYEIATKEIRVEGTEIVPCALHEVLDGKNMGDYAARVEPNENGGRKMALRFVELLDNILNKRNGVDAQHDDILENTEDVNTQHDEL
ncbi:hypothetical protein EJ02DRAFT_50086 [Clathrospora elynae]|uniref:SGNH hydrolase n=1 Tax=Clathrospora elynae TaxID=706981 RepID=A0A6A5SJQ0_9PLEO|nr:hypothetical protein EJ02DRAFT_50086 [Clathrospora elynae]